MGAFVNLLGLRKRNSMPISFNPYQIIFSEIFQVSNQDHRNSGSKLVILRFKMITKMLKDFVLKYKLELAGILLGAIGGWLYWNYVGCMSGTCSITSKPVNSTLYGALMGGILLSLFKKEKSE